MKSKKIITLTKTLTLLAMAIIALVMITRVQVRADDGKTVRVSTAKQLKAAMKDPEIGVIILRTQAYLDLTIKQTEAAKNKILIIDTPQAKITNKAVFAEIQIDRAMYYQEKASGNSINVIGSFPTQGIEIAKKKKVESLTINIIGGSAKTDYKVRKGAKIKKVNFNVLDAVGEVENTYNSKDRQQTLKFKDEDGFTWNKTITFDKSGRITKAVTETDRYAGSFNFTYTYDKNGNCIKSIGYNDEGWRENPWTGKDEGYTMMSFSVIGSGYKEDCVYTYDKKGRLISEVHTGEEYEDDNPSPKKIDYKIEVTYDKKGRELTITETNNTAGYVSSNTFTYNSKGFAEKVILENNGEVLATTTYKYNEAGDMIETKYTDKSGTRTTVNTYDNLGNFIASDEL